MQSLLDEISNSPTSKQDFEKFVKQQKIDKNNNNVSTTKETESKTTTYGAASFFYKISEIVALTSTALSDTYSTFTAGGTTEQRPSTRKRRDYEIIGDVMQINADDSDGAYEDDEISEVEIDCNGEINKKTGRKDEVKWAANNDEEEPPPPYDSSWALPKTSTEEEDSLKDSPIPSPKDTDSNVESDSASTSKDVQYSPTASTRRRQIRVGRPRRLIRKKSTLTEASTPKGGEKPCDDPDKLLLKVSDKLSDMIAQGRAALVSTVELTDADILMAEEKEREEKIMKELSQPSIGRSRRKNVTYSEDYFTTISDGNYSSPDSLNDFGGYGAYNGYVSNGYAEPNMPKGFVNGPVSGGFGGSTRFGRFGPNSNNGGFGSNYGPSFGAPNVDYSSPEHYNDYGYSAYNGHGNGFVSNGFAEPTVPSVPKGFGAGPVSGGFGGPARFGRFGASNNNNGGFGTNYGSFAPSNVGGYTSGMYNNREFIY